MYTLQSLDLPWTATQEKSIAKDFPFIIDSSQETPELYVARTYLQFLWLPESIMPLDIFVPCIQCVKYASSSSTGAPHPLHALLAPLLQTARSTANKYQLDLPRILREGGGSGDLEESMMWYARHHEKMPDNADSEWTKKSLQRMEHREVQIQILLHFLLLSLPGPPPGSEMSSVKRRKNKNIPKSKSTADHLESFMDKLSTWQLMGALESDQTAAKDDSDWMQIFCSDIVEPQFKSKLPDLCALFRSKLFPQSPFPDSRSPSPSLSQKKRIKHLPEHHPLLALSSTLLPKASDRSLARSRSLSVTLAQEQQQRRAKSAGLGTKKRVISREVSMSRVLKPKQPKKEFPNPPGGEDGKDKIRTPSKVQGVVLVADTPVKHRIALSNPRSVGNGTVLLSGVKEEDWDIPSSPAIRLLAEDDEDASMGTPSKAPRRKVDFPSTVSY